MDIKHIKPHEIVKVLTIDDDDVEETFWAKVVGNEGQYLFVTYLSYTDKVYKGATVLSFDTKVSRADPESVAEHYPDTIDLGDVGIMKIDKNMYVVEEEVDSSDDDSDIYEQEDDDENEYDMADEFIVPDDEMDERYVPPPDAALVDSDWEKWQPKTNGEKRFKDIVDRIEAHAIIQVDNSNF